MQVPSFILKHTTIKGEKMWQFYLLITGWTAVYTAMSISVLLFLQHIFGSLLIAGLAIAIGNSVSFFLDGFITSLQKRFHSRQLFLVGIVGMIISMLLFIMFSNPVFVFLAAIVFSVSFDIVDITSMSYIMAKSLPANYGVNLSYKETAKGFGLIIGLLISGIVIGSSYFIGEISNGAIQMTKEMLQIQNANFESSLFVSQIILLLILLALFFFAFILFDKDVKVLSKGYIIASFQELKSETIKGLKNSAISVKQHTFEKIEDLKNIKNHIELKSTGEKKSINWKEIFGEMSSGIILLKEILTNKNNNFSLFWLIIVITFLSYWDTFLGTFFPLFFTEFLKAQSGRVAQIPGSFLSLILILPVLLLYPIMAKMGDQYGRYKFILGGLGATAFAVIIMGIMDYSRFTMFILMGLVISVSYVAVMSSIKAETAGKINEFVAVSKGTQEIDTNVSAGPLMMTNNFGNIIGPFFGGLFIDWLGFQGFFLLFGILLLGFFVYSMIQIKRITAPSYVLES